MQHVVFLTPVTLAAARESSSPAFARAGLERERVDGPPDLAVEDVVYEAVLLDPAAPFERGGRDGRPEMVSTAGEVFDVCVSARNAGLDPALDVIRSGHREEGIAAPPILDAQ
jgi:hypothetical protein